MEPHLCVNDKQQEVSFTDRLVDLTSDLDVHWRARVVGNTARVDQPECPACPIGLSEVTIARRARFLGHNRAFVADDAIEERRLPDVRPSDERDHRNAAHAATSASRGSPSCTRTSMKSYDG